MFKKYVGSNQLVTRLFSSSVISGKWSSEYIEHVVIREVVKLLNLRCLDLGYIPYN